MISNPSHIVLFCPVCGSNSLATKFQGLYGVSDLAECHECQSQFLLPQPSDERLSEIYGVDYYEPWEFESSAVLSLLKSKTSSRILNLANLPKGQLILELGSGLGYFAEVAVRLGYRVTGVDINPHACEVASRRVPEARFVSGILAETLEDELFDAIVMIDFLEHVRDPFSELQIAASRLRQGGKMLISTPRTKSITHRLLRFRWPQYREEHLVLLSRKGLTGLIQKAGLTTEVVRPTKKYISLNYLYGQLIKYPVPLVTPLVRRVWPLLPLPKSLVFPLYFGEMTVVATKR